MKCYCDRFFYISIIIAHLLLFLSFNYSSFFWVFFTPSLLILITIAFYRENVNKPNRNLFLYLFYGGITGVLLYLFILFGKQMIIILDIPLLEDLKQLYAIVQPSEWWHYLVLFLIIIPGEEIFWRGYILKRLTYYTTKPKSIIYASLLYASAHIYSDSILLILAAIITGMVWGSLYLWKKDIWLSVLSHLVFNLLLLVLFPLL